uniref:Uncharacterized protein n=1 Tax=Methylophaga nitratireducenticrescens TaxID=754476 RepID=I1XFG5_METNJ
MLPIKNSLPLNFQELSNPGYVHYLHPPTMRTSMLNSFFSSKLLYGLFFY